MTLRIGMENNVEGRSLAWVLGHPGCFAYGIDADSAFALTPKAIQDYKVWIADHQEKPWDDLKEIEVQVVETWEVYSINENYELVEEGYEINAWFQHDWVPLTEKEIRRGIQLLTWTRADLMASVKDMTPQDLEQSTPGERWNYAGILNHVGGAEWWYLDRLGLAFPREKIPKEPFD